MEYARSRGARTIALTCNRNSPLERAADFAIVTEVGAEVLAGSSRMKAGTAHKMVLNMISTGAMARLGYVYGNLMVNVWTKNEKLVQRADSNPGTSHWSRSRRCQRRSQSQRESHTSRGGDAGGGSESRQSRRRPEEIPRACAQGHRVCEGLEPAERLSQAKRFTFHAERSGKSDAVILRPCYFLNASCFDFASAGAMT